MSGRQDILLAGRVTSAHLVPLSPSDRITLAPATHKGACIAIPGVTAGMTFDYEGASYKIVRAWDEAADAAPEAGARHVKNLNDADAAYYRSRKGKFINLLLVEAG